jgi:ABC-2 type transport system ATP-binding protein
MCEQVIIISKGKLVATDTVGNLAGRLRGGQTVLVEVEGRGGTTVDGGAVQQKLEQVSGVSRVIAKSTADGRVAFEVESMQGQNIRAELARAVVESGWNLNELHALGLSLEEVFLQLTGGENK